MKLILGYDLRLGLECAENLNTASAHKWTQSRVRKFEKMLSSAASQDMNYVLLFGSLFGAKRISEAAVDRIFEAVNTVKDHKVIAVLNEQEYLRLSYREDKPEQLILLNPSREDRYADDNAVVEVYETGCLFKAPAYDSVCRFIQRGGVWLDGEIALPSFEPSGYDEAEEGIFGWASAEIQQGGHKTSVISDQKYRYCTTEVCAEPDDNKQDILAKIDRATLNMDADTFVRLTIAGRTAFGLSLFTEEIRDRLQNRLFYAEVYDNTVMDIDEETFENDISLRSEFIRLALHDESLSDSERGKLISSGWNALNGKEVPNE